MLGSEPPPASIQWENPLSRRGWFFPSNVTYAYFNIKNFALVEVSSRFFLPFMSSQVRGAVVQPRPQGFSLKKPWGRGWRW